MAENTNEVDLPPKAEEPFVDPTQTYPKKEYYNIASTNLAASQSSNSGCVGLEP